uniref:Uncharacterized protein n=1 Tax=Cacopsylla melanoneura TaxID=428564 RepID=A0A8D8SXV5_9HEMI
MSKKFIFFQSLKKTIKCKKTKFPSHKHCFQKLTLKKSENIRPLPLFLLKYFLFFFLVLFYFVINMVYTMVDASHFFPSLWNCEENGLLLFLYYGSMKITNRAGF